MATEGLRSLIDRVSNEGRWGPEDELGTLNHITPERVVAAVRLVRTGEVVSLAHDIDTHRTEKNRFPATHMMIYMGPEAVTAADQVTIVPHSFTVTHVDAVSHGVLDGRVYNGRRASEVVQRTGLTRGSVLAMSSGFVTRGVLLDVAAAHGVDWLDAGTAVTPDDLDRASKHGGIAVGPGDAVIVRVGLGAREGVLGAEDVTVRAGLVPECLQWMYERDVAVYGGDCFDLLPGADPDIPWAFHQIGLAAMGLALVDNMEVEVLAGTCRRERRWEFLLAVSPLRIPGGTGSPVNPLAVF